MSSPVVDDILSTDDRGGVPVETAQPISLWSQSFALNGDQNFDRSLATTGVGPAPETESSIGSPIRPRVGVIPRAPRGSKDRFEVRQVFEGTVLSINEDAGEFVAELRDITDSRSEYEEEATFPIDDVVESDRPLFSPGATFRWVIGYLHRAGGNFTRANDIRFIRIPGWSRSQVDEIELAADEAYKENLDVDRRSTQRG